ncbi:MAG TPA: ABC transporter permease [Candidatus Sulfotelmatobacter sp.]|nr:ABC transporter permease [Candidatus Sulfotelmatobacter sp.]
MAAVELRARAARPAARPRRHQLLALVSLPLFFGLWEIVSRSGVINQFLFPPPSVVLTSLIDWASSGELALDTAMSVSRVVVGYVAGAVLGIVVGAATGRYPALSSLLTPTFQILRPIPPVALVPVVILWFGLSEAGKYFLVLWGVFFTVWIAAHLGVQRVDPLLVRAAQALGTPERRMLREILLPAAMPYIFVGLRTSVSISFYTLVAAELAGTFAGVAYRIDLAHQNLQIGQMMGGLVILGLLSAGADRGFAALSRSVMKGA